ncbi:PAS domain S-box protein [Paenibacillus abyssi]|uniref:Circadian input-output histidine kinase CikA n=1 Tax=Paenibacillus abyssi TaxID=1340531 RepID=A0A917CUY3_9BACL|nr:PAS domain S-box protein [Paenibacillus abyssi]GGF98460.1 hypothetical protein GCM10010916_14630 [Paenibacillus abyssi]
MNRKNIDFLGDITIVVSPALRINNVNKSIFNFLLYTEEELIGKHIRTVLPEYQLDKIIAKESRYIPFTDTILLSKNGDKVPISVSASAVHDEQGNLLGIMLLMHSVLGRNQVKVTLMDINNRYRAMTDYALDAVIVMNSEGMVIEWNAQAELQFGWSEDEVIGSSLADLIIPHDLRERHQQGLMRFMATGEYKILNKRIELSALHRLGHHIPVELTVTPIRWGDTYLFSAFIRDITERKETERALVEAKEAAEAAALVKSKFLATMSHEIRTPLNGIVGMTQLLKETILSREQQEYLEYILKSEDALLAIINDILDFSKIDAGMELEEEPFDLVACVEESLDILSTLAKEKDLEVNYMLDTEIPQYIVGDVTRLRQILINLIGNSLKFTASGGVFLSVNKLNDLNNGQLELLFTVKDTGIGIPKDKQTLLFLPFSQVDSSTNRMYGGTGLGLAICKSLVELMGGEIWAEPDSEGATFRFTIITQPADSWSSYHQAADTDMPAEVSAQLRILIAEDNEINQKVLLYLLEKEGFHSDVVHNGYEVLEAIQHQSYDLILMDIEMPGLDGIEVAQMIRKNLPAQDQPKMVAVTANAFTEDKEKCLAVGMDDYISKPFNRTKLLQILKNLTF